MTMKYINRLFIGLATAGMVLSVFDGPAGASPLTYNGVCPSTSGHSIEGTAGVGNATDCNLLIVFGPGGAITTTGTMAGTYETIDDSLIGVVNNSGQTLSSFTLSGPGDPFAFDIDGIDVYVCVPSDCSSPGSSIPNNSDDSTGYGGPLAFFTNISSDQTSGTVNIGFGGLATGTGATDCAPFSPGTNLTVAGGPCNATYFSLEGPADLNETVNGAAPEPATMTLLGTGLACGLLRRRKRRS
jgi:hypothetical protein